MAHYFDTSALVKLAVPEAESRALFAWVTQEAPLRMSSDLARTELMRAVRRSAPAQAARARDVLNSLTLLSLTSAVLDTAGRLEPSGLRSLDAIHIASALELQDDLGGVVTYDAQMSEACRALGVHVLQPGT